LLKRFGVSLESDLLVQFDELLSREGYSNRSEAIRDLIRDALVKREWEIEEKTAAGIVIIVYDHHLRDLSKKITNIQHGHFRLVISSMHAHLDEINCLEIILMKGKVREMKQLADSLISTKGIKYGKFVSATTGKSI
jgi:CopG family transcriptional regulator, nickel-responsive regulator